METPPNSGENSDAEKSPYDEAALETEVAAFAQANKWLGAENEPVRALANFLSNFHGFFPGGEAEEQLAQVEKSFANEPEKLARLIGPTKRKMEAVAEVLKEMNADQSLVLRAGRKGWSENPETLELVRKTYIALRNRGYSHNDLRG